MARSATYHRARAHLLRCLGLDRFAEMLEERRP